MGLVEWIAVCVAGVALLAALRLVRARALQREVEAQAVELLPQGYHVGPIVLEARRNLSGAGNPEGDVDSDPPPGPEAPQRVSRQTGAVVAAEAAFLYGPDALGAFLAIDDAVYEGLGRLAGEQFTTLADLSAHVGEYSQDFWGSLSPGALNKVAGAIGEVRVAEALADAGLDVTWPEISNQPGWDLLVAGHEVNVKLVSDADSLTKHFTQYPEVPAVVPADALDIPADALHTGAVGGADALVAALGSDETHLIIVDDLLSHDAVFSQAADATEVLLGSTGIVEAHLPFITLTLSGWRELQLLAEAKTQASAALRNLGLDVLGTGICAAGAAKAGAAAGGVLAGPVGATVGGILAAIVGALGGRKLAERLKQRRLRKAQEGLEQARQELATGLEQQAQSEAASFQAHKRDAEDQLRAASDQHRTAVLAATEGIRDWRQQAAGVSPAERRRLLDAAREELLGLRSSILAEMSRGLVRRLVWPSTADLARCRAISLIDQRLAELSGPEIESITSRSQLYDLLAEAGLQQQEITDALQSLEAERKRRKCALRCETGDHQRLAAEERRGAVARLAVRLRELQADAQRELTPVMDRVRAQYDLVLKEAKRLGRA